MFFCCFEISQNLFHRTESFLLNFKKLPSLSEIFMGTWKYLYPKRAALLMHAACVRACRVVLAPLTAAWRLEARVELPWRSSSWWCAWWRGGIDSAARDAQVGQIRCRSPDPLCWRRLLNPLLAGGGADHLSLPPPRFVACRSCVVCGSGAVAPELVGSGGGRSCLSLVFAAGLVVGDSWPRPPLHGGHSWELSFS